MMKRILVLLILCTLAAPLFAEEAKLLPRGVFRFYLVPAYSFAYSYLDEDGDGEFADSFTVANFALAVEYGILDWLSLDAQWTPGWNFSSDFEADDKLHINGLYDVFLGAKLQFIGEQGLLLKSDKIRLSAGAGVKVPMPSPDWEEEYENMTDGDPYKAQDADKHTWGMGGRLYFDYVFTRAFYINFFTEFIYFFDKNYEEVDLSKYIAKEVTGSTDYDLYGYRYDWIFEIEPTIEYMLSEGVQFGFSLPVNVKFTPDFTVDGDSVDDTGTCLLKFGPEFGLFLRKIFLPTELRCFYYFPLMGRNSYATHQLGLIIKSYLKF
jgi:hypothetical protein